MKARKSILMVAAFLGTVTFAGTLLFSVMGAGTYGSPFTGSAYEQGALALVLLFGPALILPATGLDWRYPGVGGRLLCAASVAEAAAVAMFNVREWGFAVHDAALGTILMAVPLFVLGSLMMKTCDKKSPWKSPVWKMEAVAIALTLGMYVWWLSDEWLVF